MRSVGSVWLGCSFWSWHPEWVFFFPFVFARDVLFFLNSTKEAGGLPGINKFPWIEDVNKLLSRALEIFILLRKRVYICMYVCMQELKLFFTDEDEKKENNFMFFCTNVRQASCNIIKDHVLCDRFDLQVQVWYFPSDKFFIPLFYLYFTQSIING